MKQFYLIALFLVFSGLVLSQTPVKTVESILITDENDETLIGVTVLNLTTKKGTISDINGQFRIEAEETDIIRFRYTGFETVELAVYEITFGMKNKVVLNSGYMLTEVIVTASKPPLIRADCYCSDYFYQTDTVYISFDKSWVYYPNPTLEGVTVKTPESTGNILVYALDGALVGQTLVSGPLTKVDMLSLPAATYILFYENKDWSSPVGKVVLNKL